MKRRITLSIILMGGMLFAQAPKSLTYGQNSIAMKFAKTITIDDLKEDLTILSSDALEGRETGKRGQKMAAAYIRSHFQEIGLKAPVSHEDTKSYFQDVKLKTSKPGDIYLLVNDEKFKNIEDILYSGNVKKTGKNVTEVVFAGSGSENDFDNLDVEGKSALIINYDRKGRAAASELAKSKGANMIFIVSSATDVEFTDFKNKYSRYFNNQTMSLDNEQSKKDDMGLFYISPSLAAKILNQPFDKLNKTIKDFNNGKVRSLQKIKSKEVNYKVEYEVNKISSENVLGYLEGTDLKDELIIITAHYDHIGIKNGEINNGADDDGSGTVAVMDIAEAFAEAKRNGNGPRRSILFMTVTGEEKGLLGSAYYAANPIFPLKNTVVDLNIDMIGRIGDREIETTNYVYLIGADKLSSELHEISENMNSTYTNMYLDYTFNDEDHPARFYYRSDQWSFAKNGIPVIFYFNGVHEDYHKHTDTVDKIEFDMLKKRAELIFYTAWEIANRDGRLIVDKKPKEN